MAALHSLSFLQPRLQPRRGPGQAHLGLPGKAGCRSTSSPAAPWVVAGSPECGKATLFVSLSFGLSVFPRDSSPSLWCSPIHHDLPLPDPYQLPQPLCAGGSLVVLALLFLGSPTHPWHNFFVQDFGASKGPPLPIQRAPLGTPGPPGQHADRPLSSVLSSSGTWAWPLHVVHPDLVIATLRLSHPTSASLQPSLAWEGPDLATLSRPFVPIGPPSPGLLTSSTFCTTS